ncbi:hypothetical protein DL762_002930 [Monosporascus cannonballus]|uniref:AA1-like domain-containing protein n=1 Tax=Monosporascus cannonballus TaxID=155416 RepID=A0ABY0HC26_9PEZI|nr:hypothetical protein DL762_002930 [Monosporascus cannonballus]
MQLITVLAASASLVGAAASLVVPPPSNMTRTNETRIWNVLDLEIKHQTGLPSTVRFNVRDATAAGEPTLCEHYNFDDVSTTIIHDVYRASCGNTSWSFDYVSVEDDDPSETPTGGKLTVQQTTYLVGQQNVQTFRASKIFHKDDFNRTERNHYYSALVRYIGDHDFPLEATE